MPALGGSRLALQEGLRDGGRGSAGARSHWFQHSLIVIETALAVVLLTSGGLLLQTFQHLRQLDLGIRSEKLLTFVTPLFRYRDFDKRVAFVNAELEEIRAIPGVVNAGAISRIPLTVNRPGDVLSARRASPADETREQVALSRVVTRDYFATVGARLREGRFFDISDRRSESPAAIVNESFANRNFPGRSPLGARFKFGQLGREGLLVHDRRRREGNSRARRGGRIEARGLSRARTGGPERGPAERHRGSHVGRAGVDCCGGPAGDLVRR